MSLAADLLAIFTKSGGNTNASAAADMAAAITSAEGSIPIGGIIAWHKTFANTPALTEGFVECNGQTLSDSDSPYDGQIIPDLNGDARFLRGGSTSGAVQSDSTKVQVGGWSTTNDPTASNSSYSIQGLYNGVSWLGIQTNTSDFSVGTYPYRENLEKTFDSIYGNASETRPVNMSVVWIMRVK